MGVIFGISIAIISILSILFLRSLTTLFHELGHAIPALLFTSDPVIVYIGTYGDTTNSISFSLGRLKMYIRIFIIDWKIGMCQHSGNISAWQYLIVILGGPVASLLISIPLILMFSHFDQDPAVQTLIAIFILAAVIDFFVNIVPMQREISMHDGSTMFNDGTQLVETIRKLKLPSSYFEVEKLSAESNHDEVISRGLNMINDGEEYKEIYKITIKSLLIEKEYVAALALFEKMSEGHKLEYSDFKQVGMIQKKLNNTDSAIKYFNHCLHLNYTDAEVLLEKGIILQEKGDHHLAFDLFKSSLHYDASNPLAYIKLAQSLIRLEEYETAFSMLNDASKIAKEHAELAFTYGLYFEAKQEYKEALKYFEKAESLGVDHHGIEFRIATVRNEINFNNEE